MLILIFVISIGIVSADTQFRLNASDPVANAQFGRSVAIAGDLVAVEKAGMALSERIPVQAPGTMYVPYGNCFSR